MCSLLRDSSYSRQPPPGTVFTLSRPLLAAFSGRSGPFPADITLTGGTFGMLRGSPLPAAWLGLGLARRGQMQVYGVCDVLDRRHPVHAPERARGSVMSDQRGRLGAIGGKPPFQHLRIVVGTDLFPARDHFGHPLFDAPKQNSLIDLQFDHRIQLEAALGQ